VRLYKVGSVSRFEVRGNGKPSVVSYLVHVGPDGRHFSYGFNPTKRGSLRYAKRNFRNALKLGTARRYNPDGGRLDGKDFGKVPTVVKQAFFTHLEIPPEGY